MDKGSRMQVPHLAPHRGNVADEQVQALQQWSHLHVQQHAQRQCAQFPLCICRNYVKPAPSRTLQVKQGVLLLMVRRLQGSCYTYLCAA